MPTQRIKLGWSGGANLLVDPSAVRDDQLTGAKDTWPSQEGIMSKREAISCIAALPIDVGTAAVCPMALFKPDPNSGYQYILNWAVAPGGTNQFLSAITDDSILNTTADVSAPAIEITQQPLSPAVMTNFIGRTLAVVGGQEGYFQFDNAGGWSWRHNSFAWPATTPGTTAAQVQSIAVTPRVCCSYRGRMIYANFGPGYENVLVFADRTPPVGWSNYTSAPPWAIIGDDVLSNNGRNVRFSALEGEKILAMAEVSMASVTQPLQTALLVLTERSAMICTGELTETASTDDYLGDFQFAKVNFDCGVAGAYAICKGPNGTFWANGDDVYAMYDGQPVPKPLGTNIRPSLQACPASLRQFWGMTYANGAIFLSVATADSSNELELAVQHWRLDLRPTTNEDSGDVVARPQSAGQARWWGPMDYSQVPAMGGTSVLPGGQGALGTCILTVRDQAGQDSVRGAFFGNRNAAGAYHGLHVISFNSVYGGRDIPYNEIVTGRTWTALEDVVVGDVIMPTPLARTGRIYLCAVAGTTGNTEPAWTDVDGDGINDGSVVWRELIFNSLKGRAPNYYGATAPVVAMEPDFKELVFGDHLRDKVFKRADLAAFVGVRQQLWLDCVLNSGDMRGWLGPCVIGGPSGALNPANNELGLMTLDASSLAEEYQARQLRPSEGAGTDGRDKPDQVTVSVVRARSIQPRLRDGSGFIIDETNDYITPCAYDSPDGVVSVTTGQIAHGYYATVPDLCDAIVSALNSAFAFSPIWNGFTYSSNPWSYVSAFDNPSPYMTEFRFTFDSRDGTRRTGFLTATDLNESILYAGIQFYFGRCARLLSMLGFDVTAAVKNAAGISPVGDDGEPLNIVGENVIDALVSYCRISGVQSIPYKRSTIVQVTDLEGEFGLKAGYPFASTNR